MCFLNTNSKYINVHHYNSLDPYDCNFDNSYCNFTIYQPPNGGIPRWQRENDETHSQNTGPSGPIQGKFLLLL